MQCKGCSRVVTIQQSFRVKCLGDENITSFCKRSCYEAYIEYKLDNIEPLDTEFDEDFEYQNQR